MTDPVHEPESGALQRETPEPAVVPGSTRETAEPANRGPSQVLLSDTPGRRLRQYMVLGLLTTAVIAFAIWVIWQNHTAHQEARANAQAAEQLCRQVNQLGQPCAAAPSDAQAVATAQAVAPMASASLTPLAPAPGTTTGGGAPTDAAGVPQAYAPGPGAMVVAIGVGNGELILTYSDGARVDAGPVDLSTLAIVLHGAPVISISPSPVVSVSPSPSPSPVTDSSAPDDTAPSQDEPSTEETP